MNIQFSWEIEIEDVTIIQIETLINEVITCCEYTVYGFWHIDLTRSGDIGNLYGKGMHCTGQFIIDLEAFLYMALLCLHRVILIIEMYCNAIDYFIKFFLIITNQEVQESKNQKKVLFQYCDFIWLYFY